MHRKWYWIILVLVLISACAKNKTEISYEAKMQRADALFAKKKYARAAELYDDVSFEKKSAVSAIALMRLADCYFNMNKFTDARLKYTQLTTTYPDFGDVQTAFFRIGVCFWEESLPPQYDQTETIQCIDAFRVFVDKFPNSPQFSEAIDYIRKSQTKLLTKKYYNGYIYYRMKDYSSALMYLEEITDLGNQDKLDRKSLYYSIRIYLAHKQTEKAETAWQKLSSRYPDSSETKKLRKYFK